MRKWEDIKAPLIKKDPELDIVSQKAVVMSAIINRRKELGMTQTELAEKTGILQAAIARIERGSSIPKIETLATLAEPLGLKVELTIKKIY